LYAPRQVGIGGDGATFLDQHFAAHGDELGGATGEGEDGGRVRVADGCRTGDVDFESSEIGVLADIELADAIVDTESARAADSRQLQRLMRAECIVSPRRGAMNEDGESCFVEHVHAIVAGDGVRADADANSRVNERQEGCDAVPKLGVRRRTVRHRAAMPRHDLDVGVVDAHAVN